MFSESPELYDLIYGSWKNYAAEAADIAERIRTLAPDAKRVLDVGCGTAEHARHLHETHGYDVYGLDIEPGFVEIARTKLPEDRVQQGDMVDFDLGVDFDVVLCLFSAIGYLCEEHLIDKALACFHRHLAPSGVVMVEPWYAPDAWHPGRVYVHTVDADGLRVVRMSHSALEGRVSKLVFHYLIGTEDGVEHRIEPHDMGLFTEQELRGCFERAGLVDIEFDPEGPEGRGLFTARANPNGS